MHGKSKWIEHQQQQQMALKLCANYRAYLQEMVKLADK